ncbi:MAG: HAD hydrolase family protein [Candidatus Nealsonbacteria bacterium]|nr:HAD hydrolase family protein [Candidatus Nealsonbacteria bacterium]
MKKPMIFINPEGCLQPEYGNVDDNHFAALAKISNWMRKGFSGVFDGLRLCSGKDRSSVEAIADDLGIVNCWQIIAGGAYFFNPTTRDIRPHPAINRKVERNFRKILKWKVPRILRRYPILQYCPGEPTCIVIEKKRGTPANIEKIHTVVIEREDLLAGWIRSGSIATTYSYNAIYIIPPMVSTGSAVKFLADDLEEIDLSMSLAIGSSTTDIPLFRCVGRIGCPSNASSQCQEAVKSRRGKVSLQHYAAGVADIIEDFLQRE